MIGSYILVQTKVGEGGQVAAEAATLDGVYWAECVTGPFDVIVRAEAENLDQMAQRVVADVQHINGVTRTLTCPVMSHERLWEEQLEPAYAG